MCPKCGIKVMTYDDRGSMKLKSKCSHCNMLVTYNPNTRETNIGLLPDRDSSSGKRFY